VENAIFGGRIGLIAFAVSTIFFIAQGREKGPIRSIAYLCLLLGILATLGPIIFDFVEHGRILRSGILLAGLIGLTALISKARFRLEFAGPIAAPLSTLLLITELIKGQTTDILSTDTPLFLSLHVGSAILGEVSAVFSFIIALMYIWQQRALKEKKIKELVELPALDKLASMLGKSLLIGFILLTLTLVSGAGFAAVSTRDAGAGKLIWAVGVWLWYFATLVARNILKKPIRMQAQLAVIGFALLFLALYVLL